MRMLENEGFAFEHYIDIFDGGPTMTARTDQVRTIRDARESVIVGIDALPGREALVAAGRLADFRCALAEIREGEGGIILSEETARTLDLTVGDTALHIDR